MVSPPPRSFHAARVLFAALQSPASCIERKDPPSARSTIGQNVACV